MSRTIRRTRGNTHYLTPYGWEDRVSQKGNTFSIMVDLPTNHPEYRKKLWEHRRDCGSGIHGVPSWYRRELNKSNSIREEEALRKALKLGLTEELVFNPRKCSAGYTWW